MDKNVYKKKHIPRKRYWQVVKTWGGCKKQKTNQNRTKKEKNNNSSIQCANII